MTSLKCDILGKTGLNTAQNSEKQHKKQVMRAVFALLVAWCSYEGPKAADRFDRRRHHPEHPLQQVQIMRALVRQHPAPLSRPRAAPPPAVITSNLSEKPIHAPGCVGIAAVNSPVVVGLCAEPRGDDPVDATELTQLTVGHHLAHLLVPEPHNHCACQTQNRSRGVRFLRLLAGYSQSCMAE